MYSSNGFHAWSTSPVPASVMFSVVITPRKLPGSFLPCSRCRPPRQVEPVQYGYATRSMPGITDIGRNARDVEVDSATSALPTSASAYEPSARASQRVSVVAVPSTRTKFGVSAVDAADANRAPLRAFHSSTRAWYRLVAPYAMVCVCGAVSTRATSVAGSRGTSIGSPVVLSATSTNPASSSTSVNGPSSRPNRDTIHSRRSRAVGGGGGSRYMRHSPFAASRKGTASARFKRRYHVWLRGVLETPSTRLVPLGNAYASHATHGSFSSAPPKCPVSRWNEHVRSMPVQPRPGGSQSYGKPVALALHVEQSPPHTPHASYARPDP